MSRKTWGMVLVAPVVVLADQGTKWLARLHLQAQPPVEVVEGLFHLVYVENPGAAFGFMAGIAPAIRQPLFHVVSLVALGVIAFLFLQLRADQGFLAASLALILGGAVGNQVDRWRWGAVVDFLDLHWGDLHWPAFNVADTAITVGVVCLIADMLLTRSPAPPSHEPECTPSS